MFLQHILIVDDSNAALKKLADLIMSYHVKVTAFDNAEEVLDTMNKGFAPDVIFMDHMMPSMDGIEATQLLKNNPKTKDIPVVMYTSKEGQSYLEHIRAAGAFGLLPKPASSETFERTINDLGFELNNADSDAKFDISQINVLQDKQLPSADSAETANDDLLNLIPELIDTQLKSMQTQIEHAINERVSREITEATQHIESLIIDKISQLDLVDYETLQEKLDALEERLNK